MTTSSGSVPPPNPLSYTGDVVVPFINRTFNPTTAFNTFSVPTIWINTATSNAFILVSKSLGVAIWVPIGGNPGEIDTITTPDSVVVVPTAGNIDFLNGTGMNITGSGSNITFNIAGGVANLYTEDSGTATPSSNNLNILGTAAQGISTSGSGHTVTLTNADWTTSQKGVGVLSTDAQSIAGSGTTEAVTPASLKAKLGTQTAHSLLVAEGTSSALTALGVASNGQIPIGSVGADPVLGNITSTGGTITVSNGAGTINLETASVAGTVNFSSNLSGNVTNATGDNTTYTLICDTIVQNTGSGYNNSTGVFTAPTAGLYCFSCNIDLANLGAGHTIGLVVMGNHSFDSNPYNMAQSSAAATSLNYSFFQKLSVSNTVGININVAGSTKTVTVQGAATNRGCTFSGFLIG